MSSGAGMIGNEELYANQRASHHAREVFDHFTEDEKALIGEDSPAGEAFRKEVGGLIKIAGALGMMPDGKLTEDDEGLLVIGVGAFKDRIVVHWVNKFAWIGMTPEEARDMGNALINYAKVVEDSD